MTDRTKSTNRSTSAPSRPAAHGPAGSSRWWLRIQGDQASVVESADRPSEKHGIGEFTIRLTGPFPDRDSADAAMARLNFA